MPSIQSYNRYLQKSDGTYTVKSKQPNHCWRLWNGAVVSTHGELVPCCFDKNRSFAFGSVLGGNFNTTWHNKKASDFRASILLNRKQYEICRNCTSKQ
jgi:radical SAM protein with 4Fe4S-binding SPASM domain